MDKIQLKAIAKLELGAIRRMTFRRKIFHVFPKSLLDLENNSKP
jgi:hypothetical protein